MYTFQQQIGRDERLLVSVVKYGRIVAHTFQCALVP